MDEQKTQNSNIKTQNPEPVSIPAPVGKEGEAQGVEHTGSLGSEAQVDVEQKTDIEVTSSQFEPHLHPEVRDIVEIVHDPAHPEPMPQAEDLQKTAEHLKNAPIPEIKTFVKTSPPGSGRRAIGYILEKLGLRRQKTQSQAR